MRLFRTNKPTKLEKKSIDQTILENFSEQAEQIFSNLPEKDLITIKDFVSFSYIFGKNNTQKKLEKKQKEVFENMVNFSSNLKPNDKVSLFLLLREAYETGAINKAWRQKKKNPEFEYRHTWFYKQVNNLYWKISSETGELGKSLAYF